MNTYQKQKLIEYGLGGLSAFLITFSLYPYVGQTWSLFIGIMVGAFVKSNLAITLGVSLFLWSFLISMFGMMVTTVSIIVIASLIYVRFL